MRKIMIMQQGRDASTWTGHADDVTNILLCLNDYKLEVGLSSYTSARSTCQKAASLGVGSPPRI